MSEIRRRAATSLPTLALEIVDAHNAYVASQKTALEHAKHVGELLMEAKEQVLHGEWLPWLEQHCHLSAAARQVGLVGRRGGADFSAARVFVCQLCQR